MAIRNLTRATQGVICSVILASAAAVAQQHPIAMEVAPTPPMGWASWNYYFCNYDEQTIKDQADALVSTGMRDLGYRYLIIQECIVPSRDEHGKLVPDAKRFPHGIPALVDYIHARGLKAGIYTDVGPLTCFSATHYQGSYDHEIEDARTFAAWGIDLIEVDFCNKPKEHTGKELYRRMAEGIRASGRPMLLYVCSWGEEQPWEWAPGMAQLWRTTEDISYDPGRVKWENVVRNFELNAQHATFTGPNSWNDPDMLEVGNAGLTPIESRTHYSMWAISAAPLWSGTDLTHMDAQTLATLTNPEVIAVDQDGLGAGIRPVYTGTNGIEIWTKPLGTWTGESQAVLLANLSSSAKWVALFWRDLGLLPGVAVRDLWARTDLGRFPDHYSVEIPSHGSALLKISGASSGEKGVVYEAEWPGNLRPPGANLISCSTCSSRYEVALAGSAHDGKGLIFPQIDAPKENSYEFSVAYLGNTGPVNSLAFIVNDTVSQSIKVENEHGMITVVARLHLGRNKVEIQSAKPIAIDCLTVKGQANPRE